MIEEFLTGPEISVLAISDGYTIVTLPAAQDHKRIGEGDTGPNTGGMGAYAPAPIATQDVLDRITKEVLQPTVDGMRKEGGFRVPYIGINTKTLDRIPFPWNPFYRTHAHSIRTKSIRI